MRIVGVLIVVTALLSSCAKAENKTPNAAGTPAQSTIAKASGLSTTSTLTDGNCSRRPPGSSPATFDPNGGTYATQDLAVDTGSRSLTFNVVQWLSGEDARHAWLHDHPDEPDGPPNDYYIVDTSTKVRTAGVANDAVVYLTHLSSDSSASVEPDSLDGLAKYLGDAVAGQTFWVTMSDGDVAEICEQYRP